MDVEELFSKKSGNEVEKPEDKRSLRGKKSKFSFKKSTLYANVSLNEMQELHKTKNPHPFAIPLYILTTKDCFAYDLVAKREVLKMRGRDVIKTGT